MLRITSVEMTIQFTIVYLLLTIGFLGVSDSLLFGLTWGQIPLKSVSRISNEIYQKLNTKTDKEITVGL
jgi:hypothetical protein